MLFSALATSFIVNIAFDWKLGSFVPLALIWHIFVQRKAPDRCLPTGNEDAVRADFFVDMTLSCSLFTCSLVSSVSNGQSFEMYLDLSGAGNSFIDLIVQRRWNPSTHRQRLLNVLDRMGENPYSLVLDDGFHELTLLGRGLFSLAPDFDGEKLPVRKAGDDVADSSLLAVEEGNVGAVLLSDS